MADKRDQYSISLRFGGSEGAGGWGGTWIITKAKWHAFDDRDGGYWAFENGEEVFKFPARDDDGDAWGPPAVRAEYERLIEYDPGYDPAGPVNLVEMIQDEDADCAFDQPCAFGHRVNGHAVYCHNSKWLYAPGKCRRTWYTGGKTRDEDCEGFQPNPRFDPEPTK